MKKQVFFSFIVLFAFTAITFAQGKRPGKKAMKNPEESAQKLTDKMAEVMSLDASTKDKVYAINLKAAHDMKAIKEKIKAEYPDKATRKANKAKIKETYGPEQKAVRKTRKESLKTSGITDEQWKKWKEFKKSQRAARGKGKGRGKGKSMEDDDMDLED